MDSRVIKFLCCFIGMFFTLVFNSNSCFAQNKKIKLSFLITSMYFSKDQENKLEKKKMLFCMSFPEKVEMEKLEDVIYFDLFNSEQFVILYGNDKKKILKELKHFEYGNVIDIKIVKKENSKLELAVNMSTTDYKLFKKMQFKVVTMDSDWEIQYTLKNEKWVLTKMIRNGF
jgi:hypothetical protein